MILWSQIPIECHSILAIFHLVIVSESIKSFVVWLAVLYSVRLQARALLATV